MKFLATSTIVALLFFALPSSVHAIGLPFGGPIIMSIPCTCSLGQFIVLGPPSVGAYVYQPATSKTFKFGQLYRPGAFLLGNYIPGHTCLMGVTPYCYAPPAFGTITMVGTSL